MKLAEGELSADRAAGNLWCVGREADHATSLFSIGRYPSGPADVPPQQPDSSPRGPPRRSNPQAPDSCARADTLGVNVRVTRLFGKLDAGVRVSQTASAENVPDLGVKKHEADQIKVPCTGPNCIDRDGRRLINRIAVDPTRDSREGKRPSA